MIGFLIKKSFFDLWDNMFKVALINLGFIASAASPILIPPLLESVPALGFIILTAGILWCFIYLATAALALQELSDYRTFGFADFFHNFRTVWPVGLVLGLIFILGGMLVTLVIPFYISMNSILGLLLSALIFWTLVAGILSFQFFFSIRARLDTRLSKVIKKSFIIFLDNPFFCILSFILSLVMLVLSALLAFLIPGPGGILLFLDEGLRLRLLKYDWLEANPEADRRKIPWETLLIDEQEKTGTRSFKSFIFPWKD
jgi:uncharacterized membrane protein YesL